MKIDGLARWLHGNAAAMEFICLVWQIVELWDDLIDADKPVMPDAINGAFYAAVISLPRNAFYQQNFTLLNSIFEAAILDWFTANALEKKDTEARRQAYVLRCGVQALIVMAARIIGGVAWSVQVNTELRLLGDSWAEYSAAFGD